MAPVIMIAIFTIGTNLMADGLAQAAQKGGD
jgi:ABC-type dipeptide/oligopeptide/nickel transport system permease subunit